MSSALAGGFFPTDHLGSPPPQNFFFNCECKALKMKVKSFSRVRLFATPWTVAYQASPSMRFSRQEYWSGLPVPSPGDLPNPGIEPRSPALPADALTSEPAGKPKARSQQKIDISNKKNNFADHNPSQRFTAFACISTRASFYLPLETSEHWGKRKIVTKREKELLLCCLYQVITLF